MWVVVFFEVDKSVDFVPDSWYNNGSCAWPKKKANIHLYVENCVNPNDRPDDFRFYDARLLSKHPIDDIHDAQAKASKAQVTSDLSSQTEDDSTFVNKPRFRTRLFPITKSQKCMNNSDESPSIPDYNNFIENDMVAVNINQSSDEPSCDSPDLILNKDVDNIPSKTKIQSLSGSSHKKIKLSVGDTLSTQPIKMLENTDNKIKENYKNINRNYITLKHDIKNIQDRLDIIMNMQEKIYEKLCNSSSAQGSSFDESYDLDITVIDTVYDLNVVEDKLNDPSFKKKMIKQLSRSMGQSMAETVRKLMQTLFTDSFLSRYSYIGFKGKNNFSTLKICKIIFESIRKMKKYTEATDIDIEKPLKNWLAQATPRIKKIGAEKDYTTHQTCDD